MKGGPPERAARAYEGNTSHAPTAYNHNEGNTMHHNLNDLTWRASVTLREGDTAANPASPERPIHGPGRVIYTKHTDGGIDTVFQPVGEPAEVVE